MKILFSLVFISGMYLTATSQIRYYTDGSTNIAYNNPASVGLNGNSTVRLAYQDIYRIGLSISRNIDAQYDKGIKLKNNILGVAGGLMIDKAGQLRSISLSTAASYHFRINTSENNQQYLSLGTRLDFQRRSVYEEGLRWPSQIDPDTGFDPDLPGEDLEPNYLLGIDVGLQYSFIVSDYHYINVSAAILNINTPNNSIVGNPEGDLPRVFNGSIVGSFPISQSTYIRPEFQYVDYAPHNTYQLSTNVLHQFKKFNLILGLGYAKNDIYALNMGAEIGQFNFILNHRFPIGTQLDFMAFKTLELNLGYRLQ